MRKLRSTMTRILVAAIVVFGLSTTAATPAHAAAGGTVFSLGGSAGVFIAAAMLMLLAALLIALRVRGPSVHGVRESTPALPL